MTAYVYIVNTDQGPEASYPNPVLAIEHLRVHHQGDNIDRVMGTTMAGHELSGALSLGALVMVTDTEDGLIATAERHLVRDAVMPAEDIQRDDASKAVEVLGLVREFVAVQAITCAETIYQVDRVAEAALPFIEQLVEVAGYHEVEDGGDA